MKLLIAGGAGSVGRALTAFFIQKGHEAGVYPRMRIAECGMRNEKTTKDFLF